MNVGETGVIVADYQRINYSDVKSISNPISKLTSGGCFDALSATVTNGGTPTPASGSTWRRSRGFTATPAK